MIFGLRNWLKSLITPNVCGTKRRSDCLDYDLPPSRLILNRLPITRPSTPSSDSALEPRSAVPSLDHLSPSRTPVKTPLLELLPLEIRQEIWTLVAGGQTHQLGDLRPGRWDLRNGLHCLCADPDTCDKGCEYDISEWEDNSNSPSRPPLTRHTRNHLCLLILCRQVYTEANDIIYSSNTFEITHAIYMEYLPLTILPQRMNTIRTLRLTCDFSGTPPLRASLQREGQHFKILLKRYEKWHNIWRILSEMASLHRLHLNLNINREWATFNRESAAELLGPVKQVTRPILFILALPISAMYEGMLCSVRRPWAANNGWEGSDPWDDLPNCQIRRITSEEMWSDNFF
ncbi:hypothetical protein VTL71DRAFT_4772 [Oculimacula yallundae]|uniref:DUF7730 domain-containing protein n=1 Tax=Oculimacula yallundae TaxID=86028 RepID=A0ABR4C318_9HELO